MARIYEYQGKEVLRKEGIPVPEGRSVSIPAEATDPELALQQIFKQ